jgi:MFS family permease
MANDHRRLEAAVKPPRFFGWYVTAGAFLMTGLTCGAFYSFGVFFLPVVAEFGWSRGMTSGVVFVMALTYAVSVPFTGLLADRFGFRPVMAATIGIMGLGYILGWQVRSVWQMYLFVGLLPGLGAGASLALPLSLVSRWFVKRQGLALGVAAAGIGVGGAALPLLATYLIEAFGWRHTFGFLGLFIWVSCLPVVYCLMREPQPDEVQAHEGRLVSAGCDEDKVAPITLSGALVTMPFWLLFFIFLLSNVSLGLAMTHIAPYAQDSGLSAVAAAGLLSAMGLCSIVGRLLSGGLSDRFGAKPVLFIGLLLQGLLVLWLIVASTPWMFYGFAVVFSLSYAGNIVLVPRLSASIFGVGSMGAIFGGLSVADGLGFAVGPLLAGVVFDISGSYHLSFQIVAVGVFLAVGLLVRLKESPVTRRHQHRP